MCVWKMPILHQIVQNLCFVKNGSNMYLGDNGAKELVIIYDHVHLSRKMN